MPKDNVKRDWPFQIKDPDPAAVRIFRLYAVANDLSYSEAFTRLVRTSPEVARYDLQDNPQNHVQGEAQKKTS